MKKVLSDLIRISNITGKDTELVQGGGGNTSAKTSDGKYMYIKASGTALQNMSSHAGWRRLRLPAVLAIVGDESLLQLTPRQREDEVVHRLLSACDDDMEAGARPSVEAHLHALLDRYVIHLHPFIVSVYVNAKNGKEKVARLFAGEKYPPLWVPYIDPGLLLARKIAALVGDYEKQYSRKPAIIFLAKHGLFVSAASPDAALRLVRKVIRICRKNIPVVVSRKVTPPSRAEIDRVKSTLRRAVFNTTGTYLAVQHFLSTGIAAVLARKDAPKLLAAGPLSPDEMVYANGPALWLDKCNETAVVKKLQARLDSGQKPPAAFLVKGLGLFVAAEPNMIPTIKVIAEGLAVVRTQTTGLGGVLTLNKRQRDFINNWEMESYRKRLAAGESSGELKGRIAVVTGAGSGLGRNIAVGLARAGALVAGLDIDIAAAQETASIIRRDTSAADACAIACNVTDENSVDAAFASLMDKWGGLDILVNAAGVAPAFALVDLPVDKWRFALEVNLTGYFLLARAASRLMIQQRMGGNIINLSSKSGLEASKNNTPYNATKAGEIHMARGWAMELGQYGIRVNSVCPGNVFEGSKIWNPAYIKVCAQKYGIKPEEVIPYYVNKTILKREIKGQDIADAVVFLCSDRARTITGQTLVVDSGQVMVR